MADAVVDVKGLVRSYGARRALDGVSFSLQQGTVLGLVGRNGAGKTTLIKHLLGLAKAQQGTVRVFGLDPAAKPAAVLSRIGYLSEEGDLPLWMRVDELIRYSAAFYPGWDSGYAENLRKEFGIAGDARLGSLSKGQRARAGLLVALAFRPELLLLDEPSSGLDPVVRRDILGAILRTIANEGRTVLFSSHLLTDVEQVSDRVVMLEAGRVVLDDSLALLKQIHHWVDILFNEKRAESPLLAGAIGWRGTGRNWSVLLRGDPARFDEILVSMGGRVVGRRGVSLDDIFVAHSGAH